LAENTTIKDRSIQVLNGRTFGWGDSLPSTWPVDGWVIHRAEKTIYQNKGTLTTPSFEAKIGDGLIGLIIALT
jgi:hypothetical protein